MDDVLVINMRYVVLDLVEVECAIRVVLNDNWKNRADSTHASAFVMSNMAIIANDNSFSLSLSDQHHRNQIGLSAA